MFIEVNMNPKGVKASDCVVRAIAMASGIDYEDVYWGLCEMAADMCRMPNEKKVYEKYLESIGFIKQKMPKHDNGTKYSVKELAEELVELYDGYAVVTVANHMTCVHDGNIYDIWNCGYKKVGNFWIQGGN